MKSTNESGDGSSRWDIWLIAAIAVVLVAGTIFVSLRMLDQSERHVAAVKEMKVRENVENAWAPQTAQCDDLVKNDLAENPDRTAAKYSNIQISENSMAYIAKMSKLRSLSLSGCNVQNRWLKHLAPLQLEQINLSDCDISDDAMKELIKIKTLRSLHLNGCAKITDRGVEIITQLPITELFVSKSKVTDYGIKILTACKTLQRLDVSATKVTSSALSQIASMKGLLTLDVSKLQIQTKDFAALRKVPTLYSLNVTQCGINDEGLKALSGANLYKINLSRNPVTAKGVTYLYSCPRLKVVRLEDCQKITALDAEKLRKAKPDWKVQTSDPKDYQWKDAMEFL